MAPARVPSLVMLGSPRRGHSGLAFTAGKEGYIGEPVAREGILGLCW